jgi:hypothetical protein
MLKLRNSVVRCGLGITALLVMTQSAPAQTTNFNAGGDGFTWTDPLNWDNGEPTLATHNAVIDGAVATPFDVQLPTSTTRTVGTARVGDGDILRLLNASSLIPSDLVPASQVTINSGGLLRIESAGSNTDLRIETGIVNLTGGGTIEMIGNAARIGDTSSFVDGELVNLDLFIHGQGQIGLNRTKLSNFGTIRADVIAGTLNIDPDTRNMVNEGVLEATNQGILQLSAATYTNTLGEIRAQTGSSVSLSGGPRINGGILTTLGDGVIETGNSTKSTLDGVTLNGLLRINNSDSIELIGTTINNAASTILINSAGSNTNLLIESPVTLTGGGTVQMVGFARIGDGSGSVLGDFTNANNLIHGEGSIGFNRTKITNNSTIRADVNGGTLTLDPDTRGFVNTSLLEATNGATLQLNAGAYTNTGGTIRAQNGSTVTLLSGPTITNGTLESVGTGLIETGNSTKSTLDNITLNGLLRINNAASIEIIGTTTNNAASTILINSAGSNTNLLIESPVTLTGGGTVQMVGFARIGDGSGTLDGDFTNVNNLIHGEGSIGFNRTKITNNSTIRADVNGGTLILDPDIRGFVNTSLLEATNGATLQLNTGAYTNTAATIRAQAGSTVTFLSGPTITGGTLETVGDGVFETANATNSILSDVTLDGLLRINNSDNIELQGTFTNNAASTILINSAGTNTNLLIESPVTLTGGGTVQMVGFARIGDTAGTLDGDLTNANNLIHGEGSIGLNRTKITNNSIIRADVNGGTLVIAPDLRGVANTNLMEATNGATLQLNAGTFTNTGGTIRAQAGSNVTFLSGPTIVGGTLQTVGDGVIETANSTIAKLDGVTIDGLVRINNADNLELRGTVTNNAGSLILINDAGSNTDLHIEGDVTLTGGGTVELVGPLARIRDDGGFLLGNLNNANNLIHGQGNIGGGRTQITNGGTISSDIAAGTLIIDTDIAPRGLANTGTLQAINTSTLRIIDAFANDGVIVAEAGSTVRIDGTLTNNAGGVLSGSGIFQMGSTGVVDIQNDGTIAPGASPGGLLIDTGTLSFGATGQLDVELGGLVAGTDYDRVDVLGDVVLAGTLDATIFGGFPLSIGDSFDVMVASGSVTGTFDTVNLPAGPGAGLGIFYGSNFVRLTVGLIQGDLNFDGFVGISDLNIVLGNWNLNVTPGDISLGDPSGDGFVGIADLNLVLGNWNGGTAFPSAPTPPAADVAVPEPATAGLVLLGTVILTGRRRRQALNNRA